MDRKLKNAKLIAKLLDNQFRLGNISFGIDSFLGFIPVAGDLIGFLLSLYIYRLAHDMRVPRRHRIQMLFNIFLDVVVGLVPFLGDIFDIVYKANVKNLRILEKHAKGETIIEGVIVERG